jgi:hypothetical protein
MLLRKKLTKSFPIEYGMRFAGQQQELAAFCWEYLSHPDCYDNKAINKRFRSAYFLFTTFCMYQTVLEKAPAKPCIIQEGFLQKSFFIRDDKDDDPENEQLDKYLSLIPLPYAVIYMDTPDINEIIKRLRGRSKIIASHFDKDEVALRRNIEKWQHAQHVMVEKLERAGVLIVRINGKLPVKENVSVIKELLKNIDETREADPAGILPTRKTNEAITEF